MARVCYKTAKVQNGTVKQGDLVRTIDFMGELVTGTVGEISRLRPVRKYKVFIEVLDKDGSYLTESEACRIEKVKGEDTTPQG